jgi:hypothetical protein
MCKNIRQQTVFELAILRSLAALGRTNTKFGCGTQRRINYMTVAVRDTLNIVKFRNTVEPGYNDIGL